MLICTKCNWVTHFVINFVLKVQITNVNKDSVNYYPKYFDTLPNRIQFEKNQKKEKKKKKKKNHYVKLKRVETSINTTVYHISFMMYKVCPNRYCHQHVFHIYRCLITAKKMQLTYIHQLTFINIKLHIK